MKVMSLPWDDKLLVLLAFFIPGFIIREVYGLFIGIEKSDAQKLLPTLVGFGALHYGFTAWPLFLLPTGTAREVYLYVDVLLLPVAWAPIALLVRDNDRWKPVFYSKRGFKIIGPQPRGIIEGFDSGGLILRLPNPREIIKALLSPEAGPWEKVLTDKARWIRIRLKSGRFVGGYYGRGSAASTFPSERQIYISHMYEFDETGKFGSPVARAGILIQGEEVETLENIALTQQEIHKNEL